MMTRPVIEDADVDVDADADVYVDVMHLICIHIVGHRGRRHPAWGEQVWTPLRAIGVHGWPHTYSYTLP